MTVEVAQLIAFILGPIDCSVLRNLLVSQWGELDRCGVEVAFDRTNYYQNEMGENLVRSLWGFRLLILPEQVGLWKRKAMVLEEQLAQRGMRTFNIDVGYLDSDKVVLPSCKRGPHKIYAGDGIWLDMLMHYSKGKFTPHFWAFEDFARGVYNSDLLLLRESFKKELRRQREGRAAWDLKILPSG